MTTFNIYCHRFKEQRLEKSREKQRKLGYKEGYDDMTSFSVLQTAWKTESAIHISNPQKWTSGFMDKRKESSILCYQRRHSLCFRQNKNWIWDPHFKSTKVDLRISRQEGRKLILKYIFVLLGGFISTSATNFEVLIWY